MDYIADKIGEIFSRNRHDPNHHLGLGDIRLTIAQQKEILDIINWYPEEYVKLLKPNYINKYGEVVPAEKAEINGSIIYLAPKKELYG